MVARPCCIGTLVVLMLAYFPPIKPLPQVHTPVVARLLRASSVGPVGPVREHCAVLLFCRLPGQPYVFCGTLKYIAHAPTASPICFVWEMMQSQALITSPAFRELLATK